MCNLWKKKKKQNNNENDRCSYLEVTTYRRFWGRRGREAISVVICRLKVFALPLCVSCKSWKREKEELKWRRKGIFVERENLLSLPSLREMMMRQVFQLFNTTLPRDTDTQQVNWEWEEVRKDHFPSQVFGEDAKCFRSQQYLSFLEKGNGSNWKRTMCLGLCTLTPWCFSLFLAKEEDDFHSSLPVCGCWLKRCVFLPLENSSLVRCHPSSKGNNNNKTAKTLFTGMPDAFLRCHACLFTCDISNRTHTRWVGKSLFFTQEQSDLSLRKRNFRLFCLFASANTHFFNLSSPLLLNFDVSEENCLFCHYWLDWCLSVVVLQGWS